MLLHTEGAFTKRVFWKASLKYVVFLFLFSSCITPIEFHKTSELDFADNPKYIRTVPHFFFGLVRTEESIKAWEPCAPSKWSGIRVSRSFIHIFISVFTFGIYTPMKVTVFCEKSALPSGADPKSSSTPQKNSEFEEFLPSSKSKSSEEDFENEFINEDLIEEDEFIDEDLIEEDSPSASDASDLSPSMVSVVRALAGADKGFVINTPPLSAVPSVKKTTTEGKRILLDFQEVSAPWLNEYPFIKKEVEKIVQTEKQNIEKEAKDLFKEFPHSALLPYQFYVKELKLFQPNNKDIISVRMKTYSYTGGAHGGSQWYTWNYSQKNKKFLTLDEVLNSKQFMQVKERARKLLFKKEKRGNNFDKFIKKDIEWGTKEKKDFKIWNWDKNHFVVVFPEYQVASYAAGIFEVHIPFFK